MRKRHGKRSSLRMLAGMLGVALWPASSWACAVCWGAEDALARSLNVSILFLMSMPFLVGGSIISVVYMAQKRTQSQRRSRSGKTRLVVKEESTR